MNSEEFRDAVANGDNEKVAELLNTKVRQTFDEPVLHGTVQDPQAA